MPMYSVNARFVVSCWTQVEANSPEEAKEIAISRPVASLCHQPFAMADDKAWHFDSDGEPDENSMEVGEQ